MYILKKIGKILLDIVLFPLKVFYYLFELILEVLGELFD